MIATAIADITNYPTVLTITNLARSYVRDDMAGNTDSVGEGQIYINDLSVSVTMANFFNSAVRELARQMRLVNAPRLIRDNVILFAIPPMYGPQGFQVADPSVQVMIAQNGYYNGTTWDNHWRLPDGCFQVVRLWERETGSNDTFNDLGEPSMGLPGVYQTQGFGTWEWREDMVVLPGSLDYRDLRMRYTMILLSYMVQGSDLAKTYLPIMDCEEAVAWKIAKQIAYRQGGQMLQYADGMEKEATHNFLNEQVKQKQGQNYSTNAYGSERPPVIQWGI